MSLIEDTEATSDAPKDTPGSTEHLVEVECSASTVDIPRDELREVLIAVLELLAPIIEQLHEEGLNLLEELGVIVVILIGVLVEVGIVECRHERGEHELLKHMHVELHFE
jgi:hypothetical protein